MDWKEFDASVGVLLEKKGAQTVGSGVLLSPTVVLTAAHCLEDLTQAWVTTSPDMATGRKWQAARWLLHPGYRGNIPGGSTDLGLIFLMEPVTDLPHAFPVFALFRPGLPFERIGYGLREGHNVRTHVNSSLNSPLSRHYVLVDDEHGFPGDSGGPVFQREGDDLFLVGVHTGRKMGEGSELLDHSYVQLLYKEELDWIRDEMEQELDT